MSMEDLFGSDLESEEEDGNYQQDDSFQELQSTQSQMQDLFGDSPAVEEDEDVNDQANLSGEEYEEETSSQQEERAEEKHQEEHEQEAGQENDNDRDIDEEDDNNLINNHQGTDDSRELTGEELEENKDDSEDEPFHRRSKPTQEDLFGEDLDVSSDEGDQDDEKSPVAPIPEELDDLEQFEEKENKLDRIDGEGEGQGEEPLEEEGHVINIELPRLDATLGKELFFIKLPNVLSIETKPFDPNFYEDEIDEDEILDDEGRARLKLKVENTIRWRNGVDKEGNEIKESNARVVRWSDGSLSLHLGNEIFDIFRMKIQGEQNHLFVQQGTGLQSRAVFKEKLNFRPHSTVSQTHRKMTMSIADRMSKTQKIRVLPAFEKDPESQRQEMIKKEEERLRAQIRRESQQRRIRERSHAKGLTPAYLEGEYEDGDEQELEESLAAIKNKYKKELAGKGDSANLQNVYSDEESEGDEKLMNAKADFSSGEEEDGPRGAKRKADDEITRKKKSVKKVIEDSDEDED